MHTEKNIAQNLIHITFGKKNTVVVRVDMEIEDMHEHLWIKPHPNNQTDHFVKPKALYVMSKSELEKFLNTLKTLKVSTDFDSSLAKCVRANNKLAGLKSHEYHCLM